MRRLPPLNSIRAFEAAAERESFAAAADELGVTQGAVSQQIKILEDYLGQKLFIRAGRGVVLSDVGRRFHSVVRVALNALELETARYVTPKSASTIKFTVLPAIASLWLVPRLETFQKLRPNVQLQISADPEIVDFARSDFHIGIRYGSGHVEQCRSVNLGYDRLYPVCSPAYLAENPVAEASDLSRCRLLHDTFWHEDWDRWKKAYAPLVDSHVTGQYFTHYSLAVDVARAGGGILMAHERLLRNFLENGELVPVINQSIPSSMEYYVVYPMRVAHLGPVKDFAAWMTENFT